MEELENMEENLEGIDAIQFFNDNMIAINMQKIT